MNKISDLIDKIKIKIEEFLINNNITKNNIERFFKNKIKQVTSVWVIDRYN